MGRQDVGGKNIGSIVVGYVGRRGWLEVDAFCLGLQAVFEQLAVLRTVRLRDRR